MNAYKVELLIVDHDNLKAGGITGELENTLYANDCINPEVMAIVEADIGDWHDGHPLNFKTTVFAEYARLFASRSGVAAQAQQAEPVGWMPIETAPKDGTEIMLYGYWAGEINGIANDQTIDIGGWHGGTSDYSGNDWWRLSTGDAYACWMRGTHWRPLPQPPSAMLAAIQQPEEPTS